MSAIKLELKLNRQKSILMAGHSDYAKFCYNFRLGIDREMNGHQVSRSKKLRASVRVFRNCIQKLLEDRGTKTPGSKIDKMTFLYFIEALSRFVKLLGGLLKLKIKKDSDSFTKEALEREPAVLLENSKSTIIPTWVTCLWSFEGIKVGDSNRLYNYCLGQHCNWLNDWLNDWLNRTRSSIDRCSLVAKPTGEMPSGFPNYSY